MQEKYVICPYEGGNFWNWNICKFDSIPNEQFATETETVDGTRSILDVINELNVN